MEIAALVVVVLLWIGLGAALLLSQSSVHELWAWYRDQSLLIQAPLALLFLPWVIGVWIWESSWHVAVRGLLVVGLAWATIAMFLPQRPTP